MAGTWLSVREHGWSIAGARLTRACNYMKQCIIICKLRLPHYHKIFFLSIEYKGEIWEDQVAGLESEGARRIPGCLSEAVRSDMGLETLVWYKPVSQKWKI